MEGPRCRSPPHSAAALRRSRRGPHARDARRRAGRGCCPRSRRTPRARLGRRRPRFRARVLPQARHHRVSTRGRGAIPGASFRGSGKSPGKSRFSRLGFESRGRVSNKRGRGGQKGFDRSRSCRARRRRARLVVLRPAQGPPGGSPPGLDKAIAAKQKHADRMLDKPGVAGIGVALNGPASPSSDLQGRAGRSRPARRARRVPVDVRDDGNHRAARSFPESPLPTPCPDRRLCGPEGVATGTLGVRVTDGTNVYALSNNHVFAGINSASIGDAIISPGDVDGGIDPDDIIGTLAAYETIDFDGGDNTMDAAIALTSPANVATSTPADGYGTPSPITAPAFLGQAVQKYGRTTGLQLGSVAATNVSVDVCYLVLFDFCLQEARFVGQISVSPGPFSAPGDSDRSSSLRVAINPSRSSSPAVTGSRSGVRSTPFSSGSASRSTVRLLPTARPVPPPLSPPLRGTRAPPSPGARPPSTAARRSRAIASIGARVRIRPPPSPRTSVCRRATRTRGS